MVNQDANQDVAPLSPQNDAAISENADSQEVLSEEVALPYIGQWNRLTSTTNWEKGRIICQWREAMMQDGSPVTEYSDEAWSQLVGGVTSQHVGRLRRVFQRFGEVLDQYEGLYWSHFQAALDWDDDEMWLEGSLQNEWSVSQMRGKRWETLGMLPEQQQAAERQDAAEVASEAAAEDSQLSAIAEDSARSNENLTVAETPPTTRAAGAEEKGNGDLLAAGLPTTGMPATGSEMTGEAHADPVPKRTRLHVDVESLPDDMAEAFESFKLAIIAHRRENWRDTTAESVVECLDALKQLALAEE